jgi:hypothetical protein
MEVGDVEEPEKDGDDDLAGVGGAGRHGISQRDIRRADEERERDDGHQPDETLQKEVHVGEPIPSIPVSAGKDEAAQREERIDRKSSIDGKPRHIKPVPGMKEEHAESGQTACAVQSRAMFNFVIVGWRGRARERILCRRAGSKAQPQWWQYYPHHLAILLCSPIRMGMMRYEHGISVVIATHNGSALHREQVHSLVAQIVRPLKIIVSDHNSTDNTLEIVQ